MNDNQMPQPHDTSFADKRENMQKRRKIVKIALIVCAVIVVLYLATLALNPDELVDRWFHGDEEEESEEIEFYPIDEDLDIFSDPDYLECDRRVFYYDPDSGATYSVEEEELPTIDPAIRFFHEYFQTVIMGEAEAYAECFVPDYEGELPESFTMQMIYDIHIEPYYSDETGENTYLVEYRILKNNGTFRRDIGSKVSRAQLYTLREIGGDYLVETIRPFTKY
jgi:hypothetical protein